MTKLNPHSSFAFAAILLLFGVVASPSLAFTPTGQLLSHDGFEPTDPALIAFGATATNRWGVESANLVTSPNDGVNAAAGLGMLEIYRTGGVVSQVAQHVDVTAYATDIANGFVDAEGSFLVNAPFANASATLAIRARNAPNSSGASLLGTSSVAFALDSDPRSWQPISVSGFNLPAGTTHVTAEIMYANASLPSSSTMGGFVDNGFMQLVPEPCGWGLVASSFPLLLLRRRRRAI